jgi:hypothetical protein
MCIKDIWFAKTKWRLFITQPERNSFWEFVYILFFRCCNKGTLDNLLKNFYPSLQVSPKPVIAQFVTCNHRAKKGSLRLIKKGNTLNQFWMCFLLPALSAAQNRQKRTTEPLKKEQK